MHIPRRDFLKIISLSLGSAGLLAVQGCASGGRFANDDTVDVSIKVQDESGKPIPYVTVWRSVVLNPAHVRDPDLYPNMDDLWRITQRYHDTFEYALVFGLRPIPHVWVCVMGDGIGRFSEVADYQDITGKGNHYPRPDPFVFGYTFMKRGYFPGRASFSVPKGGDKVEAVVTLKRDPSEPLDDQPYMQTFDRIRYELSDTRKNTAMSGNAQTRLDDLRATLEQTAQQALAANDKKSAARIYIRMRYLPVLEYMDGRIIGFAQTDVRSEYSQRAFQRASELDPDNLFVRMETIFSPPGSPLRGTPEGIRIMIGKIESIIAQHGVSAWPKMYDIRAGAYGNVGEYEKARRLYQEAAKIEPRYTDWTSEVERLKFLMKMKGVPVPGNW